MYDTNDGRFPDDSRVWTGFPVHDDRDDRTAWPLLPGVVLGQCGPDEWHILIDVDNLADEDEDGNRWYPACFRDASEIRSSLPARHA